MTRRLLVPGAALAAAARSNPRVHRPFPTGDRFTDDPDDYYVATSDFPGCCQIEVLHDFPFHEDSSAPGDTTTFEEWLDQNYSECRFGTRRARHGQTVYDEADFDIQAEMREEFVQCTSTSDEILFNAEEVLRNRSNFCIITLNEDQQKHLEPLLTKYGFMPISGPYAVNRGRKRITIYLATGPVQATKRR